MKKCTKCLIEKSLDQFGKDKAAKDGKAHRCKECKRRASEQYRNAHPEKVRAAVKRWQAENVEQQKAYRKANKAAAAARSKRWDEENRERAAEKSRRWRRRNPEYGAKAAAKYRSLNPEKVAASKKAWNKANPDKVKMMGAQRRSCPKYRIEATVRTRLHRSVAKASGCRTFDALGYTSDQLRSHLERQFQKGMCWDNYGDWHIDHILPLSSFDYATTDDPAFKQAWALANLRPLWADENQAKSDKRTLLI